MAKLEIRKMEIKDIDEVIDVEVASHSAPWTKEIFFQEITKNEHAHYFIIKLDEEVIGYGGVWIVIDDAQVTNIAIKPRYRGNKFGEKMFQHILHYAFQIGVTRLSLEVRASNIIAQQMYRKFGLVPGGVRKRYYTDNQEDAIVMWVNL